MVAINIDENQIETILNKLLAPLLIRLDNLATKSDLQDIVTELDRKFDSELKIRDEKIEILEQKFKVMETEIVKMRTVIENQKKKNLNQFDPVFGNFMKPFDEYETAVQKEKKDLLVIGDSILKYIDLEKVNPNKSNVLKCIPGGTIASVEKCSG